MYRQKNTVGNLENVGFSLDGHEGLYNVYMMEEIQSIFATGAGAVTKLVKHENGEAVIKRIFRPKYPYEYLRDFQQNGEEITPAMTKMKETILEFFK
jgi:oxygen-independent coproporphyrinogen-3 oxidase